MKMQCGRVGTTVGTTMRLVLTLGAIAAAAAASSDFDGSSMCVLYCYDTNKTSEQGFHIGACVSWRQQC